MSAFCENGEFTRHEASGDVPYNMSDALRMDCEANQCEYYWQHSMMSVFDISEYPTRKAYQEAMVEGDIIREFESRLSLTYEEWEVE